MHSERKLITTQGITCNMPICLKVTCWIPCTTMVLDNPKVNKSMTNRLINILQMTLLLIGSFNAFGQQVNYQRQSTPQGMQYQFDWHDHGNNARSITFTLTTKSTQDLPTQQQNYNHHLALRAVEVSLMKAASKIDPRSARFTLNKNYDSLTFYLSGKDQNEVKMLTHDLQQTQSEAMENYLSERYYHPYQTPHLQEAIKPDHVRYIEESTLPLIPLAQSLYDLVEEKSDARSYINLLLSWVQSIPYDELTNRISSNGSGFSPPLAILNQNKGDCDSKSVLSASLMRAFLPSNAMRLILLNKHALLAIAMTPKPTDKVVMLESVPYVLLDPTGPAQFALGEVSDSTAQSIASRQFTVETIPFATARRQNEQIR